MIPVNLIGQGAIGAEVADWIAASGRYRVQTVIRRGQENWPRAALTIDTAGPDALRTFGPRLLAEGSLWTVGAAALIDADFRARMQTVAEAGGHHLRLFTGWIAGPALTTRPARLHIRQIAPNLGLAPGVLFDGPLAQAAQRFPDHLNTATAAALTGPGIAATTITLTSADAGGPHGIDATFECPGSRIDTSIRFDGTGPHPVAAAIIAGLTRRDCWVSYG